MRIIKPVPLLICLMALLPITILVATALGAVTIPIVDLMGYMLSGNNVSNHAHTHQTIIFSIRLPRVLLAACVGALLAATGTAMQGLFRNPLADPSLIGVTAGASLGGSLMIFFFSGTAVLSFWGIEFSGNALSLVSIGAFIGGLLAVYIVHLLAKTPYGTSVATMLLAGIAMTALTTSVNSVLEFISDNDMLRRISLWRMGGMDGADMTRVSLAFFMVMIMAIVLPRYSQPLNALLLGESEARHLGVKVEQLKRRLIILVAACVGVCVALSGTIIFIGLVVPHIVRLLIGPDHRFLIPASALAGALLLVLADLCARLALAPTELPVGLVTSLVGVPFFVFLLRRGYAQAVDE